MLEIIVTIVGIIIISILFDKWDKRKGNKFGKKPVNINQISNEEFESVRIGTQVWMAKNLSISKYQNGDPIEEVNNVDQWGMFSYKKSLPVCFRPRIDITKIEHYGRLYNYHVLEDPRGVVPSGWRIPTSDDWKVLIEFFGGYEIAANKIKSTTGWESGYNGDGSNNFEAFPAGYLLYNATNGSNFSKFIGLGYLSAWWTLAPEGQDDEYVEMVMKLRDKVDNRTFGKMLLGELESRKSASYETDFYSDTEFPWNACSIRLIQDT